MSEKLFAKRNDHICNFFCSLQDIAELLRVNVPMAMKLGLEGLKDSVYKTRDNSITDVGGFESVELSVLLCNDEFICKLNKEWRGEDHATDVLSMSQHVPELKLPVVRFSVLCYLGFFFDVQNVVNNMLPYFVADVGGYRNIC